MSDDVIELVVDPAVIEIVADRSEVEVVTNPSVVELAVQGTQGPGISEAQMQAVIDAAKAEIIGTASAALDTLGELSDALGDDANYAATVTTLLSGKVPITRQVNGHELSADVTVTKSDVGLSDVDNTSDATKLAPYQKKPVLSSWPTYVYGNSYAILSGAGYFTIGSHYTQQIAAALGGGAVTSYAIAGKRILDVIAALQNQAAFPALVTAPIAGGLWPGVSSRNGLVVLDSIINDIGHYPTMVGVATPAALPTANTRYLDSMALFYRHALAIMSSESRVENSARTATSGTWSQNVSTGYASGGNLSFTTANGAYNEFSITPPQSGPLCGVVFVHGFTVDAGVGTMAQQTISVDGVVQLTRTPSAWEQYTGPGGGNVNVGVDCFAITIPVDGAAHTVRLAHSGTAGHLMYNDFISIPSIDPNPIAVMGGEHSVAFTGWTSAQRSVFHANAKAIIPVVKNVVAEFPHAFYAPSTITPNGLYSADGLHPNDRGMAQRANDLQTAMTTAIRAKLESRRLASLADVNFTVV